MKLASSMYHNPAMAAAGNSIASVFGKTDKTGLDPSAIWENEQQALAAKALAAKREKETAQIAQAMGFWDKTSQMPGFNAGWQNSNADQIANSRSEQLYQDRVLPHLTPENLADDPNQWSESTWRLLQSLGGERDPLKFDQAASPSVGQAMFDADQSRQALEAAEKVRQLDRESEADIAGLLARKELDIQGSADQSAAKVAADNVRALEEANIKADSDLSKSLLTQAAGSTHVYPSEYVKRHLGFTSDTQLPSGWQRVGNNYQYTAPSKPSTSSTATVVPWTAYDDSEVAKIVDAEFKRLPKIISGLDNIDQVPGGMWQAIGRKIKLANSVTDKSVRGGRFFKRADRATKAFMQKMMAKGLTEIDVSWWPWGEFYMPTALMDNYLDALRREEITKEGMLDDLTNTVDGWGIEPEMAEAVVEWAMKNSG